MAKFLRVIFNLLLMCYIVAALALFVPPLVGVATAVTYEETQGNQEIGTVNYGWRTPVREIQTGDEILVTGDQSVNVYTVLAVDTESAIITVSNAADNEIPVRTYVYKSILAVPYLGYIAIMLQTQEGMITLGAIAGILLVLCIITAIWARKVKAKHQREAEEELEDEKDNQFFRDLASQKRESDARAEADYRARQIAATTGVFEPVSAPRLDEEYEELPAPKADEEYEELPAAKTDMTAAAEPEGDLDEADSSKEEDMPEKQTELDDEAPSEKKPFETSKEPMAVEPLVATGSIPGVQAALEAALNTQQIQRHVRRAEVVREPELEAEPLSAEEIELAMPVRTVDEYLQKAYAKGKDPVVRKDQLTGVTYVDYSDCI